MSGKFCNLRITFMNTCIFTVDAFFFYNFSKPGTSQETVERDDSAGVLGKLSDLSVYDNPPTSEDLQSVEDVAPVCRQGKSGTK